MLTSIQVGDLVLDNNGVGFCYKTQDDGFSMFVRWIDHKFGITDDEQYWSDEVACNIRIGKWRVIRRHNNGKTI